MLGAAVGYTYNKAEIEQKMAADPSDFEALAALAAELEALSAALDRDVERWAELAAR